MFEKLGKIAYKALEKLGFDFGKHYVSFEVSVNPHIDVDYVGLERREKP
jgi:hypothetical protein